MADGSNRREERFSTEGKSFEEALRLVLAGGKPGPDNEPRLSDEELRQLRERVEERYSDPEYREKLRKVTPDEQALRERNQ